MYEDHIKYGIIKTSFSSRRPHSWEEEKAITYALMIVDGLGKNSFFVRGVFDDKETAKNAIYGVRQNAAYDRRNQRYGYSHYSDKIWIHEVICKRREATFLPTISEIKKGLEIMKSYPEEDFGKFGEWIEKNEDMSPKEIREKLIEDYLMDN